jgi:ribonuclease HI
MKPKHKVVPRQPTKDYRAFNAALHESCQLNSIVLYTYGGCSGNNQPDAKKRTMVATVSDFAGTLLVHKSDQNGGSNNIAELWAVELALQWAADQKCEAVEIRTDSRNNLPWVRGNVGMDVNDYDRVLQIKKSIDVLRQQVQLALIWVRREKNLAGFFLESASQGFIGSRSVQLSTGYSDVTVDL